jgi:hypothetical protein
MAMGRQRNLALEYPARQLPLRAFSLRLIENPSLLEGSWLGAQCVSKIPNAGDLAYAGRPKSDAIGSIHRSEEPSDLTC